MTEIDISPKPILGNRYQIQQTIGTGGMAVVYLARDLMLERQVAVKLLRQRYSRDEAFRKQFHMEAKAAANLSHQNIVTVYDFGLDTDRLFIVMEYIPGTDLRSIMQQSGKFQAQEALGLLTQACFGIGYAHRSGLVHCDVKPHNMLVTPDQRLKVTDFGIARILASISPDEQHDVVWGSPLYFSPEQASGEPPSPASDVYSLGVILYEMVTGQTPFISNDPDELVQMHREVTPQPPGEIVPDIDPTLEQIILKVLAKKPTARYANADQLGRVLTAMNRQLETHPAEAAHHSDSSQPGRTRPPTAPTHTATPSRPIPAASLQTRRNPPTPDKQEHNTPAHDNEEKNVNPFGLDWATIGLGLLATLAVGGLIPFWMYIWFSLNLPGK